MWSFPRRGVVPLKSIRTADVERAFLRAVLRKNFHIVLLDEVAVPMEQLRRAMCGTEAAPETIIGRKTWDAIWMQDRGLADVG